MQECALFAQSGRDADTRSNFFQDELDKVNGNGWHGSVSAPLTFGIEGALDVSGHYGSAKGVNSSLPLVLAGPRFVYHGKRFCFFSQTLFGYARVSTDTAVPGLTTAAKTDWAFAMAPGGGFDIRIKDKLSLRLVQLDYINTNFNDFSLGAIRVSTGVVLHLGKR